MRAGCWSTTWLRMLPESMNPRIFTFTDRYQTKTFREIDRDIFH